jgi:hypothetical protein
MKSVWQALFFASVLLFAAAKTGRAQSTAADTQACTNGMLVGPYGYSLQGNLVNTQQQSLEPYADMGSLTADG